MTSPQTLNSSPDHGFNAPFWAAKTSLSEAARQWGRRAENGFASSIIFISECPLLLSTTVPSKINVTRPVAHFQYLWQEADTCHIRPRPFPSKQADCLDPAWTESKVARGRLNASRSHLGFFVFVVFLRKKQIPTYLLFLCPKRKAYFHPVRDAQ